MIALLPVSRYRVRYQVASGRPYSFFDRFILDAIGDGHASLDSLERTFRVHRRVLIESVVTLMQAGWVAIDRNTHELLCTTAGKGAIQTPNELPKNIVVQEQTDFVIGERVQGQVTKGTDVAFSPRSELRGHMHQAAVIPTADVPHPLESGIVVPLLRIDEGEWIRSCGPIDIIRDGADVVVVDVDVSSGTITGIPSKWVPLLREELLDRARSKERELLRAGTVYLVDEALTKLVRRDLASVDAADASDLDEWLIEPGLDRMIVGGEQHHALLEDWLENARSYIGIVSGTLDVSSLNRLVEPIRAAVHRGVLVDVMWGIPPDDRRKEGHGKAFELLKKIELDSHRASGSGRLMLGQKPTGSHAKILIGDVSETFETVVGSYNWLASNPAGPQVDLSLLFRERGPVARIARLVADLAAADEGLSTGFGPTRLRYAAADLDRQIAEATERQAAEREKGPPLDGTTTILRPAPADLLPGNLRVRIVVGRQHHAILPILASEARHRLVVACHRWGRHSETAFKPLREALERGCGQVEVRYGVDVNTGTIREELTGGFEKLGGAVRETPHFHARIAVADDDTAVVTSFDWLCPYLDRGRPTISDIGFVLRGSGIGSMLLDHVGIPRLDAPAPLDAVYVSAFRIERIRSVNRAEWRLDGEAGPGWHVFVGDNGSGKTSILRVLALALIGSDNAQTLRNEWATWLRGGETNAEVEVSLQLVPGTSATGMEPSTRLVKLVWERTAEGTTLRGVPAGQESVLSAGYGPFRRFSGGDPEYEKQLSAVPELARHISLFNERVALTESLAWLRDLKFKELENDPEATLLLDRVRKLVNECGLLPCGVRLEEITSYAVVFRDEHDCQYGIEDLSDGYRSILSLTFDIVRQLAIAFGPAHVFDHERRDVVTAPAIVLIDEVDAHLHPAWQRTIGQWFRKHFPRIQFIVTTHSPLVCQAAEIGSVYRLPDPADESDSGGMLNGPARARLVYGNVLDAYASGAFGEGITRSETSKTHLRRLADLNRKELTTALSQAEQGEQERLRAALPSTAHVTDGDDSKP